MTLDETLEQLKTLGNAKVRAQSRERVLDNLIGDDNALAHGQHEAGLVHGGTLDADR